jgi:fatty acid-binding protein DegV
MLKIITDSTWDLGPELAAGLDIEIIPLFVTIGGKSYRDGIDMHSTGLFSLVDQYGELPHTTAPSSGVFEQAFDHPGESL